MTQWKNQVTTQESEGELSETVPARARSARKLVNKPLKKRARSGTASSAQSRTSTSATHTDDGTVSPATYTRPLLKPVENRSETPTEIRSSSETSRGGPPLRRIPSGVSLSATRPVSPPVSPSEVSATTPSLTPAVSATTDDEETDFQSAYSASPRESYGSFENGNGGKYDEDDTGSLEKEDKDGFERHSVHTFAKLQRERVSSTATAIQRHDQAQPSPTFSEDTVISRGTLPKRIIVEA